MLIFFFFGSRVYGQNQKQNDHYQERFKPEDSFFIVLSGKNGETFQFGLLSSLKSAKISWIAVGRSFHGEL
jgi:hypothetical protein